MALRQLQILSEHQAHDFFMFCFCIIQVIFIEVTARGPLVGEGYAVSDAAEEAAISLRVAVDVCGE